MKLATIATLSLCLAALLCLFTLWIAEAIAKATMPRIEITQTEIQP